MWIQQNGVSHVQFYNELCRINQPHMVCLSLDLRFALGLVWQMRVYQNPLVDNIIVPTKLAIGLFQMVPVNL
jgi:hypothetical protein